MLHTQSVSPNSILFQVIGVLSKFPKTVASLFFSTIHGPACVLEDPNIDGKKNLKSIKCEPK